MYINIAPIDWLRRRYMYINIAPIDLLRRRYMYINIAPIDWLEDAICTSILQLLVG